MVKPHLDHPTLPLVKAKFPGRKFLAAEFRGQTTLVVGRDQLHDVMAFLRSDPACDYNLLSDVVGIDYHNYPSAPGSSPGTTPGNPSNDLRAGRFAVVYNLESYRLNRRFFVKVHLDPSIDTSGIDEDPTLYLPSMCDLWPGAEWPEREVYDMFGIRFTGHPDLRRILTWEKFPAHPLRKDYPVTGRGERETYKVVDRDNA